MSKFKSDEQRKAVMSKYNKPPAQLTYLSSEGTQHSPIPDWLRDDKDLPQRESLERYEKLEPYKTTEKGKPGPKPTKSLGTTKRSIKVSFYVPSTRDGDKPISDQEFSNRITETESFMRKAFSGTTSVHGEGTFTDKHGKPVKEQVAIVETSIDPSDYRKYKAQLVSYAKHKKQEWGQESIAVEMEDTQHHRKQEGMHFIE